MMKKHFTQWTRKEFEALPRPDSFWNNIGEVDSLVILPCKRRHDSGYRCMEFVAIQNGEPTYLLSGCSDVINLGGIGGYNVSKNDIEKYSTRVKSQVVPVNDWSIDCLPVSGLPRLFCRRKMIVGASISSFEVYFKEDE
jgi:hypothetical protein